MDFIVRELRPEDFEGIYLLNKNELGYDYSFEETKKKLKRLINDKTNKIFAAESEGRLCGYIHVCEYDLIYFDTMLNVLGIAVSSEFRRCGIGKALLAKAEEYALSVGIHGIRLNSGESRTGAHEFYKNCGYTLKKKQMNFIKEF